MKNTTLWPIFIVALVLIGSVVANIQNYHWNLTSVFHMDTRLADERPLPTNFIVLDVPSYDGAQYYQVARNMPLILSGKWTDVSAKAPGSYAYQRFLLPLVAWVISVGSISAFPWVFVLINILALLLSCAIVMKMYPKGWLYAIALGLSPAAMIAMHFTLAEPLTILLIVFALYRMKKFGKIDALTIIALSLVVLAREVNILFIGFLIGYSLLKMRWRDALLLIIPVLSFLSLHTLIYGMFGNIPFLLSAGAHEPPGHAAWVVLSGQRGYDKFTLSAIALLLGFVLPNFLWFGRQIIVDKKIDLLPLGAFTFLCIMLLMPNYIWGSITSIGRVITPVYPLSILALAERDTRMSRVLAAIILIIGIGTAVGLALQIHPFALSV